MLQMGAAPHKLILGIPLYGRTFIVDPIPPSSRNRKLGEPASALGFQGKYTRENGFMGYNEVSFNFTYPNKLSNYS